MFADNFLPREKEDKIFLVESLNKSFFKKEKYSDFLQHFPCSF